MQVTVPTKLRILPEAAATWKAHKKVWDGCTRCPLHANVCNYVLARGTIPCEVLFIGEAPGEQEDHVGRPFVGKAGRTLHLLLKDSFRKVRLYSYSITNVVACIPFSAGDDIEPPPKESAEACWPRLQAFITSIAVPDAIVLLGKQAEKHQKRILKCGISDESILAVNHPSYINRNGGANSLHYKRTLNKLCRFLNKRLK